MNTDIRTLKIVVDSVQETDASLSNTDLSAQLAAAGERTGETLAAEFDVEPGAVARFLTEVVADDDCAERITELEPHERVVEDGSAVVATMLAELSERNSAVDSLADLDWSRAATVFVQAVQRELVSTERLDAGATSLWSLGAAALQDGHFDTAENVLEVSRDIARRIDDTAAQAKTRTKLGDGALRKGNVDTAEDYYSQSLQLSQEVGDRATEAASYAGLGNVALQGGELEAAETYHQESLDITRDLGERSAEANSLASLGTIASRREDFGSAEAYLQECLDLKRLVDDRVGEATTLASLGSVAESRGEYATAIERYTEALDLFTATGQPRERLNAIQGLTESEQERGNRETAIDHCETGLELIADTDLLDASDERRSWFRTTHAQLTRDSRAIESLYETALDRIQDDDDAAAFKILDGIWDSRSAFGTGSETHDLCLRAGVGFAAYHLLLDSETVETVETTHESISEEIESQREGLSEPAAVLFEFVRSGGLDRELTIDATGISDPEGIDDRERLIYAAFLDRISRPPEPSELYSSVLTGIVSDDRDLSKHVQFCLMAWEQRDDDEPSRAVLGAGLLAEAYRDAFGVDLQSDQQAVFDFIADHRSVLSDPLEALFDHLATGSTETTAESLIDAANMDRPTINDVERMAVARFLEQLKR